MSRCWCGVLLAILVIVFAWVDASWARIVLTALGALLAIKAVVGKCCCQEMMAKCCGESEQADKNVEQGD